MSNCEDARCDECRTCPDWGIDLDADVLWIALKMVCNDFAAHEEDAPVLVKQYVGEAEMQSLKSALLEFGKLSRAEKEQTNE